MQRIVLLAYELGLTALLILVGPFLLLRHKAQAGLLQKLGFISKELVHKLNGLQDAIWFHTVSVGEFNAVWPLIEVFHQRFPDQAIVISTTTATGQELARKRANKIATIIYFPFDLPWIVSRWLSAIRPRLVAILETELWPCFVDSCFQRNIPIVILNGRVSPQSHRLHRLLRPLYAPLLNKCTFISAQSKADAQRYRSVGGDSLSIAVQGNLKYDGLSAMTAGGIATLRNRLNIKDNELVLVAGSTHEGEEVVILNLLNRYRKKGEKENRTLKVIIAPRHPERFDRVAQIISAYGYTVVRHSQKQSFENQSDVFLLDTIGSLAQFYSMASVAFVGGTIAKIGGHNLVEPYAYGVPVVCGPSIFKTKDTAQILCERKALIVGANAQEVENQLLMLLDNSKMGDTIGQNGRIWLSENQGAVTRALESLKPLLESNRIASAKKSDRAAVV